MGNLTRIEAANFLQQGDDYLILTHRRPDGDTLGSAAALCRMLRRLGKTAHILENPEASPLFRPLLEGLTTPEALPQHCVVSVDIAAPNLLTEAAMPLLSRISLRIDHHATATSFTPYALVDSRAGACAEIIYDLGEIWGLPLDKPTAEAVYTGISTDTGCFRYPNTTAHTFQVAAACALAGGDLYAINLAIFETNSLAKLKIQSWMMTHAQFYAGGKIALCALPKAVEREIGVTEDDMESISGFLRSIAGVKMAATLRELADGKVKLSLRAVPGYDAAAVCAVFGGGGHAGAAGATLALPLQEAARVVAQALPEME